MLNITAAKKNKQNTRITVRQKKKQKKKINSLPYNQIRPNNDNYHPKPKKAEARTP